LPNHTQNNTFDPNGNPILPVYSRTLTMTNRYEIRLAGQLDDRWQDWFDGMSVTLESDGTTLLTGPVPDQPALYGILRRVRDLGLPLVSVRQHISNKQRITSMNSTSQRPAALTAGLSLLVMFFAAMFANFAVVEGMLVPDDGTATLKNVLANLPLFRFGVIAFLVVLVCDVLAAWGLYVFFAPANEQLSKLAGWLRLTYTAVFGAAIFSLVSILHLLTDASLMAMFETSQLQAQVMLYFSDFNSAWTFSLVLFGVHLFVLGYLIVRSGHAPKWIGVMLILAAIVYTADSFAKFLMPNYPEYATFFLIFLLIFGIIGELSLCLWLLFKGGKGK
jgi:hypothetical protein